MSFKAISAVTQQMSAGVLFQMTDVGLLYERMIVEQNLWLV